MDGKWKSISINATCGSFIKYQTAQVSIDLLIESVSLMIETGRNYSAECEE